MAIDLSTFKTKKSLTEAVQSELARFKLDEEFESELLQTLIAERHYHCSANGLVPQKFKKTANPHGRSYYLWATFPGIDWHGVSWHKCIDGWSLSDEVVGALRRVASPFVEAYLNAHRLCERCHVVPSCEVDHVEPEFKEIVNLILPNLTEDDWQQIRNCHDWVRDETFTLPDGMWCTTFVRKIHDPENLSRVKLMAVCKKCHKLNARDRKNA